MNSIFEELKMALGCQYISDIRSEKPIRILNLINCMALSRYSLAELSSLSEYISEKVIHFESHAQAEAHFSTQLSSLMETEV